MIPEHFPPTHKEVLDPNAARWKPGKQNTSAKKVVTGTRSCSQVKLNLCGTFAFSNQLDNNAQRPYSVNLW